jgi:hypothetical protein
MIKVDGVRQFPENLVDPSRGNANTLKHFDGIGFRYGPADVCHLNVVQPAGYASDVPLGIVGRVCG